MNKTFGSCKCKQVRSLPNLVAGMKWLLGEGKRIWKTEPMGDLLKVKLAARLRTKPTLTVEMARATPVHGSSRLSRTTALYRWRQGILRE
jgi:hypothetical protein